MVASQVDSSIEKKHCDTVYESVYHGLLSANFVFLFFRPTADNPTNRKVEARGRIYDGGTINLMGTTDRRNAQTFHRGNKEMPIRRR